MHRELVVFLVLLELACASHSAVKLPPAPEVAEWADPSSRCPVANGGAASSVIGAGELRSIRASNLYDAIRRLRPSYFDSRGPSSIYNDPGDPIVVIANRHVIGGVEELRAMDANGLACIRRLPAAEVSLLTGRSGWSDGIELVFSKSGGL